MARPIDEKIVAMKMDNSDFKKKAVETTGLFGKLKDSLNKIPGVNLGKITNDLSGIKRAANGVDMTTLGTAVESISGRFSALGVVATTALVNISNKAVNAGLALSKSLGIDQITAGFGEYELKIGSIGTVLSNTEWNGTGLKDVNKAFSDLNDYADQTIYNFAQMTQNIGRFTAAGVTLGDSTTAIKGLGNLAAISGSTSDQLNTAMYQMSQALASGKLNLMDWNSMVNAGMGGKKTQDALVATAKKMGMNVDLSEGFRNSISDGWLTSKVFLATLKQFGDDESMTEAATKVRTFSQMMDTLKEGIGSGWAETWEIIFGDFEEATKLWTGLSDFFGGFFGKQAEARNKFLKGIFEGDGLTNMFESLKNIGKPIAQLFGAIGAGFKKAFPPTNVSVVKSMIEGFKNFTKSLAFSESTVKNLGAIFDGFFSILAIGWKIVKGAVTIIVGLIPSFDGLGAKIIELIAKVAKIPSAFNDANDSGEAFTATMEFLKKVAGFIADSLEMVVGALILFVDVVTAVWTALATGDMSKGPWNEGSAISGRLKVIRDAVVDTVNAITEAWSLITKGDFTGKGPWNEDSKVVDWLTRVHDALKNFAKTVSEIDFGNSLSNFISDIQSGLEWINERLVSVWEAIKNAMPDGNQLFAGGFIAGLIAVVVMALKMAWKLYDVFTGWGEIGGGVAETLEGVGNALNSFSLQVKAQALLTIAIAVGVLAGAFWAMSGLDSEDIVKGLYAIVGSLSALVLAMAIMTKYDITGTGLKAAVQIVALSVAFSVMAGALNKLSELSWGQITKGVFGLVGVMGTFSLAVIAMSKFGGGKIGASSLQFLAIAAALHVMLSVVKKIAEVKVGDLIKGVSVLGIILAQMALFLKVAGGSKFGATSGIGIVAIAGAILLMVKPIKDLGEMDVGTLQQGLITITLILLAVSAFAAITGTTGLLSASVGLVLLAGALTLMMIPIASLGNMDLGTLAKGVGSIAVALLAIGAASMLMTGMVGAGIGVALIAGALILLMIPIAAFAAMSWESLLKGMVGLALSLTILAAAGLLLAPATIPLLVFGAAVGVLGLGLALAGAGIALFSAGLVLLAAMTGTAIITIVAMLGTLIAGLVSLIPQAVDFVWTIILKMASAIEENAPTLATKMYDAVIKMLNVFSEKIPEFAKAATDIITAFLGAMEENIPRVIEAFNSMMVTIIESMATSVRENGPLFIGAFMQLMAEVAIVMVDAGIAMIEALFGWIPGVSEATATIGKTAEASIRSNFNAQVVGDQKGTEFASSLGAKSGDAGAAGTKVGHNAEVGADGANLSGVGTGKGNDFVSGLASKAGNSMTAGMAVGTSAEAGAGTANLSTIGSGKGTEFATGLASKVSAATTSGTSLATGGKAGASSVSLNNAGLNFGSGFASGISGAYDSVVRAGKSLAKKAKDAVTNWLDIHSPSRLMMKDGGFFGEGFAMGIRNSSKKVWDSAKGVAQTAKESLNKFIDGFEMPEEDNELHFKAVIDYDTLDTNRFGKLNSRIPDTSFVNRMASATNTEQRANAFRDQTPVVDTTPKNDDVEERQPAVIQVVTPEKRELARWLVDDITDFQDFKMATTARF